MLFVGVLAGIKAVSHTAMTVRVDVALTSTFCLPASKQADGSERGYLGRSPSKTGRKLVSGITTWSATSSPGREVAAVPDPVEFVRPLSQYAVRTPSKEQKSGYYHAIVFTSRTELSMQAVVDHYDGRAGMEADLKGDKHGLGLATIRKHRLAAQKIVILLLQLAHNVLLWARQWLSQAAPRLHDYGIVRLIQQVWAIPGRIKLTEKGLKRVRLRRAHPRARDVCRGFRPLLLRHHMEELLR